MAVMHNLDPHAAQFLKKSKNWTITFRFAFWTQLFNTLLFGLYIATPVRAPFELIFGSSPYNLWLSIGIALFLALLAQTAYHRAHGYHALAKQALGETPDATLKV